MNSRGTKIGHKENTSNHNKLIKQKESATLIRQRYAMFYTNCNEFNAGK
jgi:hypothetical protein